MKNKKRKHENKNFVNQTNVQNTFKIPKKLGVRKSIKKRNSIEIVYEIIV